MFVLSHEAHRVDSMFILYVMYFIYFFTTLLHRAANIGLSIQYFSKARLQSKC